MKDKISIVIPCYNEEKALPLLINDIYKLFDTLNEVDFEIIMVDNSSTDNTLNILRDYSKTDNRFHYKMTIMIVLRHIERIEKENHF